MRMKFFFFVLIISIVILSGCIREYDEVVITSIDVMSSLQEDGTKLTITPYIQNNLNADTGVLTLKVKIKEPSTNLIVAEKDSDIGYIKSKSSAHSSASLTVSDAGEYMVEVQIFEGGRLLSQNYASVTVKEKPGPGQPSDIKLIDMNLVVTKIYSDGSAAIVDVSPGVYNQGGDSMPLTIEITARIDQYTAYTRSDQIGTVKGSDSMRSKVTFDLPRNREYSFSLRAVESGRTAASAKVNEKIKLNELKYNVPVTYSLVEEGKPVAVNATLAPTKKEPGFETAIALACALMIYTLIRKRKSR